MLFNMFKPKPRFTGFIPDKPDDRDIPFSAIADTTKEIPEEYRTDFMGDEIPVDDQDGQPDCVARASSKIKEFQESTEGEEFKFVNVSPRFIYAMCKKIDGYDGEGTSLRVAMKVLQKYGGCLEPMFLSDTDLSHDDYKDWTKITEKAFDNATKNKINTYASVPPIWELLKQAIYEHGVVLAGMILTHNGWKDWTIRPPKKGEKTGGHAILLFGYDKDYIYFLNSWGDWGHSGVGRFGKEYLDYLFNSWTATDIPYKFIGWVAQERKGYSEFAPSEGKVVTNVKLNLRKNSNTDSEIILTLPKNASVNLANDQVRLDDKYIWRKVEYKNPEVT